MCIGCVAYLDKEVDLSITSNSVFFSDLILNAFIPNFFLEGWVGIKPKLKKFSFFVEGVVDGVFGFVVECTEPQFLIIFGIFF